MHTCSLRLVVDINVLGRTNCPATWLLMGLRHLPNGEACDGWVFVRCNGGEVGHACSRRHAYVGVSHAYALRHPPPQPPSIAHAFVPLPGLIYDPPAYKRGRTCAENDEGHC